MCALLRALEGRGSVLANHIQSVRSAIGGVYNQCQQEDAHDFMTVLVHKCESERTGMDVEGEFLECHCSRMFFSQGE